MTNDEIIKFLQSKQLPQCGDKEYTADEEYEAYQRAIKALEQTTWIPVSERLPNLDDYAGSEVWKKKVLITGYLSFDDTKRLFVSEAFAKDVICNCIHDVVVIAWMPLPPSYQGEENG